jgi:hypothetical protein
MAKPTQTKRTQRFLGDDSNMVVHDLERAHGPCEIDEILDEGRGVRFEPDSLEQAEHEKFQPCYRCINSY